MKTTIFKATLVCGLAIGAVSCKDKEKIDDAIVNLSDFILESTGDFYNYYYINIDGDTVYVSDTSTTNFIYSNGVVDKGYYADEDPDSNYFDFQYDGNNNLNKIEAFEDGELVAYILVEMNANAKLAKASIYYVESGARAIQSDRRLSFFQKVKAIHTMKKQFGNYNKSNTDVLEEIFEFTYDGNKSLEVKVKEDESDTNPYIIKYTYDGNLNPTRIEYLDSGEDDGVLINTFDNAFNSINLIGPYAFFFNYMYSNNNLTESKEIYDGDTTVTKYTNTYDANNFITSQKYFYSTGEGPYGTIFTVKRK